jgi:hypothetical protein
MANQPAREQLISELKRHGLPRAYIQRMLDELDDHLSDLHDERNRQMNSSENKAGDHKAGGHKAGDGIAGAAECKAADGIDGPHINDGSDNILNLHQRLGDPAQLAAFAAKQYHNRSFLGRHPILTFLLLPLPLTALGIAAVVLVFYLIGFLLDFVGLGGDSFVFDHQILAAVLTTFILSTIIILPPFLTGLLLCRIARRNALNWWWYVAACAFVAFYCGQVGVGYNLPNAKPSDGFMFICLGCFPVHWRWVVFHFLPKFVFAMGICLLLIKRAQRLQKLDQQHEDAAVLRQAA